MKKYYYKFLIFFILLAQIEFVFSQGIGNDINIINKLRKEHFDFGKPLDTLTLAQFYVSKNNSIKNIATLIKASYDLEQYVSAADKKIVDLIYDKSWIENPILKDLKELVIDDLFRICMASKRYMLFHKINTFLYFDKPLDLFSIFYETYIYLKTGNIYRFLDKQSIFKTIFINCVDSFYFKYNSDVFNRLKLNVISFGYANYDTIGNSTFDIKLRQYVKQKIDTASDYENIVFAHEIASFQSISDFNKLNDLLRNKLVNYYCSPFLLNTIYTIIDWPENSRKFFLDLLYLNRYPKGIGLLQSVDFYFKDYSSYQKKLDEGLVVLGNYDLNSALSFEQNAEVPEFTFVDSLLRLNYFFEPNWVALNLEYITKKNGITTTIKDGIDNINNVKRELYAVNYTKNIQKIYNIYKKTDFSNLIEFTNIYFAPFLLLDYYSETNKEQLKSDTSYYPVYDSLLRLLNYSKSCNYFTANGLTLEKRALMEGVMNTVLVFKDILLSSKLYHIYEDVARKVDISQFLSDSIPIELTIIKDKYRYLNFIKTAADSEKSKFDTIFIKQLDKYLSAPYKDSSRQQNRFYFHTDVAKNILLDVHFRKNISDSLLLKYLSFQEVQTQVTKRFSEDQMVYNLAEDSIQPISVYKNPFFCIDNTGLKFARTSDTLFYKSLREYQKNISGDIAVDLSMKVIWYFIADSYDFVNRQNKIDFDSTNYFLYVAYYDSSKYFFRRLISIDSLYDIIDLDNPKSSQFFGSTYFSLINDKSDELYNILLKPIENYIGTTGKYKLVLPSTLTTLPLDFLYAKKKGVLPHFVEYSDISGILYPRNKSKIGISDTVTVFSGMNYNDIYCNINKAYNPNFRSGIVQLKYSNIEKDEINKSFKVKSYVSSGANKFNFLRALLDTNTLNLHLITHGAYIPLLELNGKVDKLAINDNISMDYAPEIPAERQLLLFSSDSTTNSFRNNLLVSNEIKYLDNLSHIKLIYLSACETGLIDDNRTNKSGYSGFVREFLDRGVQSVIATRWKIQDKAASDFASVFYKNLVLSREYEDAFYQTKLKYFKDNMPPFIWTSYVFVK